MLLKISMTFNYCIKLFYFFFEKTNPGSNNCPMRSLGKSFPDDVTLSFAFDPPPKEKIA